MKQRVVEFAPEAREDLRQLYDRIADRAELQTALGYVERLESYCRGLDIAAERGHRRDDVRPGLRIVGFERQVTIAFSVSHERVTILRLFYAGQDWTGSFEK